jgi:hypothetical protein
MSLKKTPATAGQIGQYGFLLFQAAVEILGKSDISKSEMQVLLTRHKDKIVESAKEVVSQTVGVKVDIWDRQIEKLTKFWKEEFNHDILWEQILFPEEKEGFGVLEYNPNCFTENDVFNKYAQKFGKDKVWKYYGNIRQNIKVQQPHSTQAQLFLHRGGQEPDAEHLGKSYDDFCNDGKQYINPLEGLIIAFRYRVETGKMMDEKGLTRFHALDSDGNAMSMYSRDDGKFYVGRDNRDNRDSDSGPREVSF